MFDDVRAAPAVLAFPRDTRVGKIVPQALRRRREGEDGMEVDRKGEEAGRGHLKNFSFPLSFLCLGAILSGAFSSVLLFLSFPLLVHFGAKEALHTLASDGLWSRKTGLLDKPTTTA